MTNSEFINFVFKKTNGEYEILKYDSVSKKFKIRHNKCGYEYYITKSQFLNLGRRCSFCRGGVKYSHQQFLDKVYNLVGDEYTVLGLYINSKTKIKIRHNKCGYTYEVRPASFISKAKGASNRCPKCSGLMRKTTKQFKTEVYDLVDNEYQVLGEYKNNKTKIKMIHNICNNIFYVNPKDFLGKNSSRCPFCKKSKGEKYISKWFIDHNIPFKQGYKNKKCKNINVLEFDFIVYPDNDNFILLEYDGRLHFEPWDKSKKESIRLEKQIINDNIKNEFTKSNNIKLIRINYKDNIDEILERDFLTSTTIESK